MEKITATNGKSVLKIPAAEAGFFRSLGWNVSGDTTQPVEEDVYDPAKFTVEEVLAHLATCDGEEQARILAAEADGKARSSLLNAEII